MRRDRACEGGRGNRAILTDRGLEVLVGAAPGHASAVRDLVFGGLSTQQLRQCGEALGVIEGRLRADEANRVAPGGSGRNRPVT